MISTIGNKLVNLQRLPYMQPKFGEFWSRNGWEGLASFVPTPKSLRAGRATDSHLQHISV